MHLGFAASPQPATKTITVYNDSSKTVYPVVSVGNNNNHTLDHLYLNTKKDNGIPKNASASINIPQNLWTAGRIYIYDVKPPMKNCSKITYPQPGITDCFMQGGNVDPAGFNPDLPYQLVEYTITPKNFDYDMSYVDHLYLPMAVEIHSGRVGYSGTGISIQSFRDKLSTFLANTPWPHYYMQNTLAHPEAKKIPGSYNVFAQSPSMSTWQQGQKMLQINTEHPNDTQTMDAITLKWKAWVLNKNNCSNASSANFCQNFSQQVKYVWSSFADDAKKSGILPPQNENQLSVTPYDIQLMTHILGYVGFKNTDDLNQLYPGLNFDVIALQSGVPYTTNPELAKAWAAQRYPTQPQDQIYNLNPYATFIHSPKYMNMNVYAFSIDDGVGNINVVGNHLDIDVGSTIHLTNQNRYVYKYWVSPGPGWTSASICGEPIMQLNPKLPEAESLTSLQKAGDTCKITYTTNTQKLSFTAQVEDEGSMEIQPGSCEGQLCSAINLSYDATSDRYIANLPAVN